MAIRRPLVIIDGAIRELPFGDETGAAGASVKTSRLFNLFGNLIPTLGIIRWYPSAAINITTGFISIGARSAYDVILQININAVMVEMITLPANSYKSITETFSLSMSPTDFMTVDLLTTGGENLTLTLEYNS
jgi:hypothetical protein